ncbi:MAG: long-chain fatty acid--CoA ligase, partial [Desulfitobacterium sp.]|nr:long-chain fatty acid--CoA ligase [Desulfitobacterium sp.]
TIRDGWLYTGDIVTMDESGYFYIVDRKKDMIITGGFNVYPREVEDVLYEHPAVREACVVGVKDGYSGEKVVAFLSLRDGAEATEKEIIAFCRKHLVPYKVPKEVHFKDELPKTAVGKILRRTLRDLGNEISTKEVAATK